MNRPLHLTLIIFVLLIAIVACVLPGQAVQPAQLAPTMDPLTIESAVAGTAQAAAQQTQQANPIPATATIAPTATLTSTPKISTTGTSLLTLADGSTQFTDHVAGVQMTFPSGWLVFRVGEPEYYAAWEKLQTQNPKLSNFFNTLQNMDPMVVRVNTIDTRPERMSDGIITGGSVIFQQGSMESLEEREQLRRDRQKSCGDHKFISAGYPKTNNGTQVLVTEESCGASGEHAIYYRDIFFRLPSGMMHLDFETSFDYKDVALPEFDQAMNSITLLAP